MSTRQSIEEDLEFIPKFDEGGLITAIAQDAKTGQVLMVGYMNRAAIKPPVGAEEKKLVEFLQGATGG